MRIENKSILFSNLSSRDEAATRVLLTTEATYPYHSGGVSTWCHALISSLPQIDFEILSIEGTPDVELKYDPPANVRTLSVSPQWCGRDYDRMAVGQKLYAQRWINTSTRSVRESLIPILDRFFYQLLRGCPDPAEFCRTLMKLNRYWQNRNYRRSLRHRLVWDLYVSCVRRVSWPDEPSEKDLAFGLSTIQNLFSPIAAEIPSADVTHSTAAAFCSIPAIILKEKKGTPMLLSEHGVYLRERLLDLRRIHHSSFVRNLYHRIIMTLVRSSYHCADRILPVCDFNSKWEEFLGAESTRIRTIYNGVDPGKFSPVAREASDAYRRPTVVSLARIDPLKDIETLLVAADAVRQHIPDVVFRLYGDVWNEEYYQRCLEIHKQLDLGSSFEFAGHTDSPADAYHEGDIVVLSSISEAFPFSVVEAMMCGRPVVATNVGGVGEALMGCGLTVEPRQPEALAESCLKLLRNERLRKNMARKALIRARSKFTIDNMIDAYLSVYQEVKEGGTPMPVPTVVPYAEYLECEIPQTGIDALTV